MTCNPDREGRTLLVIASRGFVAVRDPRTWVGPGGPCDNEEMIIGNALTSKFFLALHVASFGMSELEIACGMPVDA